MKATLVTVLAVAGACTPWLPPSSISAQESKGSATPRESRIHIDGAELYSREIGPRTN